MSKDFRFAKPFSGRKRKAESDPEVSPEDSQGSGSEAEIADSFDPLVEDGRAAVFDSIESFISAWEAKNPRFQKRAKVPPKEELKESPSSEKKDFPPPNKS